MNTRKHRKWYQLSGMLRAGKFEGVVDTPFVIYHLSRETLELETVTHGNCCILCKGNGLAVDKKTASITGNYDPLRLFIWAGIHPEDVESARQQLNKQSDEVSYRFANAVRVTAIETEGDV